MRGLFVERMKKRQKCHRANDKTENVEKKDKTIQARLEKNGTPQQTGRKETKRQTLP